MKYSEDGSIVTLTAEQMNNITVNYKLLAEKCYALEEKSIELQSLLDQSLLNEATLIRNATLESSINQRITSEQSVLRRMEDMMREAYIVFDGVERVPRTKLDERIHVLKPKTITDEKLPL